VEPIAQRLWALARNAVYVTAIPGVVLYFIPHLAGAFSHPRSAAWLALAALPGLLGAALILFCLFKFAWDGLGTLAVFDAPRKLVLRGPYRYTRNPMYVGVIACLLAGSIAYAGEFFPIFALAALLCVNLFVRFYEEPTLRRKFGDSYRQYCQEVPRWFRLSR
jgi:protein-S-isoprenylcysteine O-methyltransferase Ste14